MTLLKNNNNHNNICSAPREAVSFISAIRFMVQHSGVMGQQLCVYPIVMKSVELMQGPARVVFLLPVQ